MDNFNDIYLNLRLKKSNDGSIGKTDEFGNYIFEVEASNENLDLQNQIVLQRALLESKDEFLKGGVISCDHLHKRKDENGKTIVDNSMVIGEPIDVRTEGKSTIVTGKLYKTNKHAREFINMLKAGSTRVRASVGGIFPKVVKAANGVEKITHVLWNDLALTTSPVNNTVGAAVFAKSMDPDEFLKALAAGYGTDHSEFTDGRALVKEDVEEDIINETENANVPDLFDGEETEKSQNNDSMEKDLIQSLMMALQSGEVTGEEDAIGFLIDRGMEEENARTVVREIINQGGSRMKKSFSESVSSILKSLTGGKDKEEDEIMKGEENSLFDDEEIDLDDEDLGDPSDEDSDDEDDMDDEDEETEKSCKKSLDEEDFVDGTELLKSLSDEIATTRKSNAELQAQVEDLGKAVVEMSKALASMGREELPRRSTMSKSMAGTTSGAPSGKIATAEDFAQVREVLAKSVQAGEISLVKSSIYETEFQRAMKGEKLSDDCWNFLNSKLGK